MRTFLVVVCALAACYRDAAPPPAPHETPPPDAAPPADVPVQTTGLVMTTMPPPSCRTDADCTMSYAGPACCAPEPSCPRPVSKGQLAAFQAFCARATCPPERPSSSCLGVIGMHAVCRDGRCTGDRTP